MKASDDQLSCKLRNFLVALFINGCPFDGLCANTPLTQCIKTGLAAKRSNTYGISEPVVIYQLNLNHAHPKMLIAIKRSVQHGTKDNDANVYDMNSSVYFCNWYAWLFSDIKQQTMYWWMVCMSYGQRAARTQGSFLYASSQWELALHCNAVTHWLGAYRERSRRTDVYNERWEYVLRCSHPVVRSDGIRPSFTAKSSHVGF